MRKKIDGGEEIMLKISQLSSQGCRARAQILSDSLRFDLQVQNFNKEDTFIHDVQLSDRQYCPRFGRNLDRKTALWRAKNPLAASVCGTVSLEPKLGFPQAHNFKKEGNVSFPKTLRTSKTDVGSYIYHAHKN